MRNLYLHILGLLKPHGIQVKSYQHHNYEEVYSFAEAASQAACTLRLRYNGKYQVTIETVQSAPIEFANQIRHILTANVRLETQFQRLLYGLMQEKLAQAGIAVCSIEHHDYQEIYYLKAAQGDVKLQLYYDADGFVTRMTPLGYSTLEAMEAVHQALEI